MLLSTLAPFLNERGWLVFRKIQDSLAMQRLRHGQGYYRQQNYCLDMSIKGVSDDLVLGVTKVNW